MPHAGGPPLVRGRLRLHAIPFVSQDDYDRLLWACDINLVRGEDSFVRAQWAARAFAWHIYPQAQAAHLAKLNAFLDLYTASPRRCRQPRSASVHAGMERRRDAGAVGPAWLEFAAARPQLQEYGAQWAAGLAGRPDLATGLVNAAAGEV